MHANLVLPARLQAATNQRVAFAAGEGFLDQKALDIFNAHVVQAQRLSSTGALQSKVARLNGIAVRHQNTSFNSMGKFAHVSRPSMLNKRALRLLVESVDLLAIAAAMRLEEMAGEIEDVFATLAQRWNKNFDCVQSKIKVLSKAARGHFGFEIGVCGGYQMLGESIHDPLHVESKNDSIDGLGLLAVSTTFAQKKATYQVQAKILNLGSLAGEMIQGYEIHMGETQSQTQWLEIISRNGKQVKVLDGSVSSNGRVWGCYLHGLFHNDVLRHAWLRSLGWRGETASQSARFDESLEKLADAVESALNMSLLEDIIWGR